jgi:hypothetical protein
MGQTRSHRPRCPHSCCHCRVKEVLDPIVRRPPVLIYPASVASVDCIVGPEVSRRQNLFLLSYILSILPMSCYPPDLFPLFVLAGNMSSVESLRVVCRLFYMMSPMDGFAVLRCAPSSRSMIRPEMTPLGAGVPPVLPNQETCPVRSLSLTASSFVMFMPCMISSLISSSDA